MFGFEISYICMKCTFLASKANWDFNLRFLFTVFFFAVCVCFVRFSPNANFREIDKKNNMCAKYKTELIDTHMWVFSVSFSHFGVTFRANYVCILYIV